jgi:hypothetical protein
MFCLVEYVKYVYEYGITIKANYMMQHANKQSPS